MVPIVFEIRGPVVHRFLCEAVLQQGVADKMCAVRTFAELLRGFHDPGVAAFNQLCVFSAVGCQH